MLGEKKSLISKSRNWVLATLSFRQQWTIYPSRNACRVVSNGGLGGGGKIWFGEVELGVIRVDVILKA